MALSDSFLVEDELDLLTRDLTPWMPESQK